MGEEGAESIVLFFGIALLVGGQRVVGWGRMSYLGPAEISSFSSQDLSRRISTIHSSLLYQMDISIFYFYEQLLLQIFLPWKFINI